MHILNKRSLEGTTRDRGLDVVKGLLICMLVIHHFAVYAHGSGVGNRIIEMILAVQRPLFVCYFMPAFFMVTGICSNFDGPFKCFIVKLIKTLLLPALVFSLGTSAIACVFAHSLTPIWAHLQALLRYGCVLYWFCGALFVAKIIYWWVHRYAREFELFVSLALSLAGVFLHRSGFGVNYLFYHQALDMVVFISVGHVFKQKILTLRWGVVSLAIYCASVCGSYFVKLFPYVTGNFSLTVESWPLHILLAMSGCIMVISLGRKISCIQCSEIVEYLGKNSLMIYLTQSRILCALIASFGVSLASADVRSAVTLSGAAILTTLSAGAIIAQLINTTRLRVVIGKW